MALGIAIRPLKLLLVVWRLRAPPAKANDDQKGPKANFFETFESFCSKNLCTLLFSHTKGLPCLPLNVSSHCARLLTEAQRRKNQSFLLPLPVRKYGFCSRGILDVFITRLAPSFCIPTIRSVPIGHFFEAETIREQPDSGERLHFKRGNRANPEIARAGTKQGKSARSRAHRLRA
jgi:hypothetical protein